MFHYRRRCLSLIPLAMFVACAATPAMAQPQPAAPASLPTPLSADAFTQAVLAHNASLEAMQQAVIAAVERIKPAGALDDPMLSLSAAPRTLGSAMGVGGSVEVSQSLPWWGTLEARTAVARAQAEAASADLDALRLSLGALARGDFADWAYIHRALEINAANQAVLTELRNTARIRFATGQAPQEDVLQADVQRGLLREQRFELTREQTAILARMNALLDRNPQAPLPPPADLSNPMSLPAEEILAQHALQHPELQMLQAQEQTATAQEQLAEKQRFPKFAVSAGYNSMWSDPAMRSMIGVSISIPLDQGKYRAEIDAAHAEARRAASTLANEQASVLADVAMAYAAVSQAIRSLALYRDELVPLSRSTLEVAQVEYSNGRGDFLNVLTAEQHQLDTELSLARLQSQYYERLAELNQASAGALLQAPVAQGEP